MTWSLVIHGGAGVLRRDRLSADADRGARDGLWRALDAGAAVLARGGAAVGAVQAAIEVLEDDPHFNAGRGAALTADGTVSLDAAIMNGATRDAGAVAGVTATRHPIALARRVMEASPHVMLAGAGADTFSLAERLEQADPAWFATEERRGHLAELLARGGAAFDVEMKYGTVGACARDTHGRLAAATSTGGVTGKRWGRIGDSPVIGAGTWADGACAVSCTGSGEQFLRVGAGHAIAARIALAGQAPPRAAEEVLAEIAALGGSGGVIVMPADGPPLWRFTTPGMYRATLDAEGKRAVAIYDDE